MTEVIIQHTPEDYFDVLNNDIFTSQRRRKLNWLQKSERGKNQTQKDSLTEIKRKETDE